MRGWKLIAAVFVFTLCGLELWASNSPTPVTRRYLARLLEQVDPDSNDLSKWLATEATPVEALLSLEVIKPRIDRLKEKHKINAAVQASITVILQFPSDSSYAKNLQGGNWGGNSTVVVQKLQIDRPTAVVDIVIGTVKADGSMALYRDVVTAEFREQSDSNNDGVWDRESCWTVKRRGGTASPVN